MMMSVFVTDLAHKVQEDFGHHGEAKGRIEENGQDLEESELLCLRLNPPTQSHVRGDTSLSSDSVSEKHVLSYLLCFTMVSLSVVPT